MIFISCLCFFQTLFDEMLEEEQENKNVIVIKIEQYLNEIAELRKVISVTVPVQFYNLQN